MATKSLHINVSFCGRFDLATTRMDIPLREDTDLSKLYPSFSELSALVNEEGTCAASGCSKKVNRDDEYIVYECEPEAKKRTRKNPRSYCSSKCANTRVKEIVSKSGDKFLSVGHGRLTDFALSHCQIRGEPKGCTRCPYGLIVTGVDHCSSYIYHTCVPHALARFEHLSVPKVELPAPQYCSAPDCTEKTKPGYWFHLDVDGGNDEFFACSEECTKKAIERVFEIMYR